MDAILSTLFIIHQCETKDNFSPQIPEQCQKVENVQKI